MWRALVVIDEINTSPMMESLLNALLSGKTQEGKLPQKPGFMIIGTQNPVTMAGRIRPSTALSRRLMTMQVPEYNRKEMKHILNKRNTEPAHIRPLVDALIKRKNYAHQNHLEPAPTFRDALKLTQSSVIKLH